MISWLTANVEGSNEYCHPSKFLYCTSNILDKTMGIHRTKLWMIPFASSLSILIKAGKQSDHVKDERRTHNFALYPKDLVPN